jgi:Ca-activated chloride channel family protein
MSFTSPLWLLALALVPLALFAHASAGRRRRRYAVRFTALSTLAQAAGRTSAWRRHLPAALALAAIASLAIALARPHVTYRKAIDQASIMLVTDHSGSMAANDVAPTRLEAAEKAANTFIDQLPSKVAVGAVAFSSSPDQVQGPVTNHSAARAVIDAQSADGATATGDALQLALQLLHGENPKHQPSAIVLLSDGAANAGIDAATVARQAGKDKIPIDTVALGSANATVPNPDPLGPPLDASPDFQLMQTIAKDSGGRTFNAQSAGQLSSIYKHLGSQLGSKAEKREITAIFAAGGLVLLLVATASSARWAGRLP